MKDVTGKISFEFCSAFLVDSSTQSNLQSKKLMRKGFVESIFQEEAEEKKIKCMLCCPKIGPVKEV